jgi:AcrR family transcriptional regulator
MGAHPQLMPQGTTERLLAAAESIVLDTGAHAVSIRGIAARSGLNSALVSYHFDGIEGLLRRLLELNVDAICDSRDALTAAAAAGRRRKDERLRALAAAYIDPLWRTTACWHMSSARDVVRGVMPMLPAAALRGAVQRINTSVADSAAAMAALLPELSRARLLARLRLVAGLADMMRPRLEEMGLYPLPGSVPLEDELVTLAVAALKAK